MAASATFFLQMADTDPMQEFEGSVRTPGDPFEVAAVLRVEKDKLVVTSNEHELGTWALKDVSARLRPDGCHLTVGGEELIVTVTHPALLAGAIGAEWTDPPDADRTDQSAGVAPELDEAAPESDSVGRQVPDGWKVAGLTVVLMAILWVFIPIALVGLLLILGTGLLLVGTLAAVDPFTAVRLPERVTAARLLVVGAVVVAVALALAIAIA